MIAKFRFRKEAGRGRTPSAAKPARARVNAPNLAAMCEKYGGGHRFVAAVTLPDGQIEQARELAREFVSMLKDTSSY